MADDRVFDEIVTILPPTPAVTRSKMFGMPCLKVNGRVFACFWEDGLSVKLPVEEVTRALKLPGITILDPMHNNRPMKEWILMDQSASKLWVEYAVKSYNYVVKPEGSKRGGKRRL